MYKLSFIAIFARSSLSDRCANKPYPLLYGASDGDMQVNCMIYVSETYLLAGWTESAIMTGSATKTAFYMIVDEAYGTVSTSGYWDPSDFTSIDACMGYGIGKDVLFADNAVSSYMLATLDYGVTFNTY
jgi:hypothetical protein